MTSGTAPARYRYLPIHDCSVISSRERNLFARWTKRLAKTDDPPCLAEGSRKEEPTSDDLYSVGTAAVIMRMLKLPDGRIRILVQGLARAQIESVDTSGEYLRSRVNVIQEYFRPNVLSKSRH